MTDKSKTVSRHAANNIGTKEFVRDMALNQITIGECLLDIDDVSQEWLNAQMKHVIESCKKYIK